MRYLVYVHDWPQECGLCCLEKQLLTQDNMLRIARRYDTAMAHAMMRALGFEPSPWHQRHRRRKGRRPRDRRYDGMLECFRNHGSPMDGR